MTVLFWIVTGLVIIGLLFGGNPALAVLVLIAWGVGTWLYQNWIKPIITVNRLTQSALLRDPSDRSGSQDAVRQLVEILSTSDNRTQRKMAFDGLCQLTGQNCINYICQLWVEKRNPILTDLLQQNRYVAQTPVKTRVLTALKVNRQEVVINGGAEIVEPLLEAFKDSDSEIANRAKQWAKTLTNPDAIDLICQKWYKKRDSQLEELIIQSCYVARTPVSVKVLSALKVNRQEIVINDGADIVEPLLEAFKDSDSEISSRAKKWIKVLTNPEAINLIYQKWTQNREPVLEELIIHFDQSGTLKPYQKALLYFLTQQWDKYESLDFEHQLLQNAYELADESLRQKIGEIIRKVGRVELVQILTGGRKGKRLSQMSLTDWNTALAILSSKQEWQQIWKLAQKAPAIISQRFLQQLKQVNWQPEGEERDEFYKLVNLSDQCKKEGLKLGSKVDCQAIITGHTGSVYSLAMNQDGTLLASGSRDNTIRLWGLPDGRLLNTLQGHTGVVSCLAMSQNGTLLASASESRDNTNTIKLWGLPEGRLLSTLITGHVHYIGCLAMNQDGTLLASGSFDKTVKLWRIPEGRLLSTLTEAYGPPAMSQDGTLLASGSGDKTVKLWKLPDGRLLNTLTGHTGSIECLVISQDGTLLASGSKDKTVRLWGLPERRLLTILTGHTGRVNCLAMSQDGNLLASGSWNDKTVQLWKLPDGRLLSSLTRHTDGVSCLAMSQDGNLLASGSWNDKTVQLWKLPDGRLLSTLTGHTSYVKCLAMSQNRTLLASGSSDHTIKLWTSSPIPSLTHLPIDAIKQEQINQIQSQLKYSICTKEERNWLEFILELVNRNRRFDIEVAEGGSVIEVGEFDIEID